MVTDKRETPGNARFWIYWNGGLVRLTLRPGQSLSYWHGEPTDEGYSARGETVRHEGTHVYREWTREGRDCDGRHRESGDEMAPLDKLAARFVGDYAPVDDLAAKVIAGPLAGVLYPAWEEARAVEVFDEFAQAAGY